MLKVRTGNVLKEVDVWRSPESGPDSGAMAIGLSVELAVARALVEPTVFGRALYFEPAWKKVSPQDSLRNALPGFGFGRKLVPQTSSGPSKSASPETSAPAVPIFAHIRALSSQVGA